MSNSKKILVIGGSGFIGSTLIPYLLANGHDVSILNRGSRLMKGTHQLIADRRDPCKVQNVAMSVDGFDVVIDTSSYNGQDTAIAWRNFSNKTKHWIHLGSAAVYKETPGRIPNENDEIGGAQTWAEYGVGKTEADQFLITHAYELPVTILRPPYLYGPHNDNDRETFVWSRALQDRPILIPNDGQTLIQFLHVKDLVSAINVVMYNTPVEAAIYNVAAKECPNLKEWVNAVAEIAGSTDSGILTGIYAADYKPRQYFPFRDYPCCLTTDLIKEELGWEASYGLVDGLKQTFGTYDVNFLKNKKLDTTVEVQILTNISRKRSSKVTE